MFKNRIGEITSSLPEHLYQTVSLDIDSAIIGQNIARAEQQLPPVNLDKLSRNLHAVSNWPIFAGGVLLAVGLWWALFDMDAK